MSRQLDVRREEIQTRRDGALVRAIEFELQGSVERAGGVLHGFSVTLDVEDCFIVLRAEVAGRSQVAFVNSDTLANCLRKCVRDAHRDRLRWKVDKYAKD